MRRHVPTEVETPAGAEKADPIELEKTHILDLSKSLIESSGELGEYAVRQSEAVLLAIENLSRTVQTFEVSDVAKDKITGVLNKLLEQIEKELEKIKEGILYYEDDIYRVFVNIQTRAQLLESAIKQVGGKNKGLEIEQVLDFDFDICEGVPYQKTLDHLEDIYKRNYAHNPALQKKLLEGFNHGNGHTYNPDDYIYYILSHKGEIVGFNRFEDEGEDREGLPHQYFSAFNIDRDFKGKGLGEVMMMQTLDHEARTAVIDADCAAFEPISMNYIERGFVATKFYDYEDSPSFSIVRRDPDIAPRYIGQPEAKGHFHNKKYLGKNLSQNEIISASFGDNDLEEGVRIYNAADPKKFPWDLLNNGFVLTRYFREEGTFYAVFEETKEPDEEFEGMNYAKWYKETFDESGHWR